MEEILDSIDSIRGLDTIERLEKVYGPKIEDLLTH